MVRRILPVVALLLWAGSAFAADITLLNVSYDPTRELYADFNKAFAAAYLKQTGKSVEIKQSHGGSGSQARAVIDGLQADVVTLALAYDIDAIAAKGLIAADWQTAAAAECLALYLDHRIPGAQGQPQGYQGLGRPDQARRRCHHAESEDFGRRPLELSRRMGLCPEEIRLRRARPGNSSPTLYSNVPVLDTGARGATVSFVERGVGDVLLAWENEAFLAQREFGKDKFEIVSPPRSILAEPPVAVVDAVADKKGTPRGRRGLSAILVQQGRTGNCRPQWLPAARSRDRRRNMQASFAKVELFTIDDVFGGWAKAQKEHFSEGGVFDQIYKN